MNSTWFTTRFVRLVSTSPILMAVIVGLLCTSDFAFALNTDELVRDHKARVTNFSERQKQQELWQRQRLNDAEKMAAVRQRVATENEVARKQFANSRKKEDPLAEEKRDALYEAEIAKRQRELLATQKRFSDEQARRARVLSSLPQINPMKEYDLTTDYERGKRPEADQF